MWPVKKCPPKRPSIGRGRFRFINDTFEENCKFVRSHVSLSKSNWRSLDFPRGGTFTTVRQHPLTARLSPVFNPRAVIVARRVSSIDFAAGLILSIAPVSSTMPVNIPLIVAADVTRLHLFALDRI